MALDTTIDSRMPQLARVIRHIIIGMKLLPPDPTQDSPTGFRFICNPPIFQCKPAPIKGWLASKVAPCGDDHSYK